VAASVVGTLPLFCVEADAVWFKPAAVSANCLRAIVFSPSESHSYFFASVCLHLIVLARRYLSSVARAALLSWWADSGLRGE